MSFEITEIIATGPGWNRVRLSDGQIYTIEGNYNWRSNNPGNIEYGDFAISMGAIGQGAVPKGRARGFAIFPTYEAGRQAKEALLFESDRYATAENGGYAKGSIGSAIYRYAPPHENNTEGYIRQVASALGVTPNTPLSQLSPQQRSVMLDAMEVVEGYKVGDIRNAQGIKLPPAEIPNVVGTKLDVEPARRVDPVMPTPASERPKRAATLPTPASDRPAAPSAAPNRLLPIIGPTGIERKDDIGSYPDMAAVSGIRRQQPMTGAEQQRLETTPYTPQLTPEADNIRSYQIPAEELVRTAVVGGRGSLTPDSRSQTKPDPIPAAASPQHREPDQTTPNVRPIQAMAGKVPMAPGARPQVADSLVNQADNASRRQQLQANQSYAGQDRAQAGATAFAAPRPVSRKPVNPVATSYVGQDEAKPKGPTAPEPRPVGFGTAAGPPASPTRAQLSMAPMSYAGQERGAPMPPPPSTTKAAAPAAVATPTVPKYITTTERVPVSQPAATAGTGSAGNKRDTIPKGEIIYTGSRDNKTQQPLSGVAAKELVEKYTTRKVTTLNPEWVRQNAAPPVAPPPAVGQGGLAPKSGGSGALRDVRKIGETAQGVDAKRRQGATGLLGVMREGLGIPADGIGAGLMQGFQNALGIGPNRQGSLSGGRGPGVVAPIPAPRLSQQQIARAVAAPQNHNRRALAAIQGGRTTYTNNDGALLPTTAMNGNVRNTYGD